MIQRGVGWGIRYIFIHERPFQLSLSNAIIITDPVSKPMKVLPESLKWQPLKLQ